MHDYIGILQERREQLHLACPSLLTEIKLLPGFQHEEKLGLSEVRLVTLEVVYPVHSFKKVPGAETSLLFFGEKERETGKWVRGWTLLLRVPQDCPLLERDDLETVTISLRAEGSGRAEGFRFTLSFTCPEGRVSEPVSLFFLRN